MDLYTVISSNKTHIAKTKANLNYFYMMTTQKNKPHK